ncbi:STAS domain-containing protein [Nonomuraea jiangxiensis]|uniref:Anti-sigma factor antagonist n=1 Tax=Nonomuraea jiangxiensis TaxID=633440 RepID=A0A1G9MRE6_9ACTN|nr:STAS domain-containing protein [Nonomuraea jiangxiensis]SDL76215.1 anti-anti-sigma factor [Nonomuraea jiangxiensis]
MSPLNLKSQPLPAGVLITVTGEIDKTNTEQLETQIGLSHRHGQPLVLDLSGTTFMDSRGLHLLLRLHARLCEQAMSLHLAAVHSTPARLMSITGVDDLFAVHPTPAAAMAAALSEHGIRNGEAE